MGNNIEETLRDIRTAEIILLREMKVSHNKGNETEFHRFFSEYKTNEKKYFLLASDILPEKINKKYKSVMLQYYGII